MKMRSIAKIRKAYETEGITSLTADEAMKLHWAIHDDYQPKLLYCMKNSLPFEEFEKLQKEMHSLQRPLLVWYIEMQ
jgi:hypothetical protein